MARLVQRLEMMEGMDDCAFGIEGIAGHVEEFRTVPFKLLPERACDKVCVLDQARRSGIVETRDMQALV